jgi:Asp-tRNA(Asn)/Glu-tRNA(Gln) amidotransferase B subunit
MKLQLSDEENWQLMTLLLPPAYLAAIIKKVQDGVINNAGAKVLVNEIYKQRLSEIEKHT